MQALKLSPSEKTIDRSLVPRVLFFHVVDGKKHVLAILHAAFY